MNKNIPFICKCGFNTMNPSEALKHTNKHFLEAFEKVKTIAENYITSNYPQAPDPILYAVEVEETLREAELIKWVSSETIRNLWKIEQMIFKITEDGKIINEEFTGKIYETGIEAFDDACCLNQGTNN